ncbi:integrin beta-like protein 1 isoform X1 [Stegostoma tigrinum]|uniref:integrin beta-like protein 1 isoform X1 n=1 Tax=Stegostoma tigrinum TaxID=3053191 RepID=UPI00286FE298|nr:integrin beta-like protein 1 isoform X1 [Stegostoma tigrinum]
MHADVLVNSIVFLNIVFVSQSFLKSTRQSDTCELSLESSEKRCRSHDGLICSGRGQCECGVCICLDSEPGKYYGSRCECQDWLCESYDGRICGGHGQCDCGKCICDHGWSGTACHYPKTCNIPRRKSKELCRNSDGLICSNAGTCHCGRCICDNPGNEKLVYGNFCECNDEDCIDDETGEICGGHGKCYCGNCYCMPGWHGDKCEFQCDITPWESKRKCMSSDGKVCSNRGNCICGECTCYDLDPSGEYGDIHGATCECDERDCLAVYDRYSDSFCSGVGQCNCGRCNCYEGWSGRICEHPESCRMSVEESARKCRGNSNLPCSGRGKCQCGQCTCFPPGDRRIYGKNCECDDRQCEDSEGAICGGNGICSCGRCICNDDWFGKYCQHPRTCNMPEERSRSLCESFNGTICSGKGSCHCGKCMCGSPQQWYISGPLCECDDRECDKHEGVICTGNGICDCGICDCFDEWTGNACEIWMGLESF